MMAKYYPAGLLGLTALMASFMSGMAGNVTAFNTVCYVGCSNAVLT
ncbi:MAG: hypothetical protein ACP5I8_17070 [Phycisphaerae bacterium]